MYKVKTPVTEDPPQVAVEQGPIENPNQELNSRDDKVGGADTPGE